MLAVARVAGITAIKNTGIIIPLAHGGVGVEGAVVRVEPVPGEPQSDNTAITSPPLPEDEDGIETEIDIDAAQNLASPIPPHGGVRISALVETTGKTGVEMEALCGVVGAGLAVVDMVKGVDRGCVLEGVRVVGKRGGRGGGWGVWGEGEES